MLSKILDWFRKEPDDEQAWVMGGIDSVHDSWNIKRISLVVVSVLAVIGVVAGLMFTFSGPSTEVADDTPGNSGPVNVEVPKEDESTPPSKGDEDGSGNSDDSGNGSNGSDPSSSSSPSTSSTPSGRGGGVDNQGGRNGGNRGGSGDSDSSSTPTTSDSTPSQQGSGGGVNTNSDGKIGSNGGSFATPGRGYEPKEGNANKKGAKVVYTLIVTNSTGSGDLDITYIDANGSPQSTKGKDSWSKSFNAGSERPPLGVSAASSRGPVTCTVSVDGIIASNQSSKKAGERVTCGNVIGKK